MNELHCDTCNKIIGFTNKGRFPKAKNMTIFRCIDCYFNEIKELIKK